MDKNEKWDLNSLNTSFEELHEKFYPKQRFIHPNTVNNLIYHFNAFKDVRIKQHVYDNLSQMAAMLYNTEIDELNPKSGALVFETYLTPLLHYYNVRQQFSVHTNMKYLIVGELLILLILYFINASPYLSLGVVFLGALEYIYSNHKKRQKKVYGLFY